jgi:general secretion pathway protein D
MAGRVAEIMPVVQLGSGQKRPPGSPPPAPPKPQPGPPGDLSTEMTITKIVPDERSNSLIVVANQRAYEWLVILVHKLDVSPEDSVRGGADDRFHIYNCAYANCDEMAATLSAVTGVQVVGSLTGGPKRRSGGTPPTAAAPTPDQQGKSALMFEGDVRITFDAPTNSLLVMSSFKDFQALRRVIEKLDAPRKQIFIEALILEVTTDKDRKVGVSYHAGAGKDIGGKQSLLLGGYNANQTLGAAFKPQDLLNSMGGLSAALFGPAIDASQTKVFGVLNVNIPSFGVFLQALQTNNDVNVLSNPHLLIMNNQEGEITVGENLPFPGAMMGSAIGGAAGYTPYMSVNRQDVALKLKLLPSVNQHNVIRLDVEQEVSDVTSPNYNNLGPATSKRSTKTTVVARDQQTVVIGGLMSDRQSVAVTKVPILGDIPVLGFFFRNSEKTMKKTNIIIAITPYVISDLADLRRVAEKKMRERREFIERFSSLEDRVQLDKDFDFHRKRGMLEEINRTVREVEDEEKAMRDIREQNQAQDWEPIEAAATTGKAAAPGTQDDEPAAQPMAEEQADDASDEEQIQAPAKTARKAKPKARKAPAAAAAPAPAAAAPKAAAPAAPKPAAPKAAAPAAPKPAAPKAAAPAAAPKAAPAKPAAKAAAPKAKPATPPAKE